MAGKPGKPDWVEVRRLLDLPADATGPEILAATRAKGILAPSGARPPVGDSEKPRAYLDAAQLAAQRGADLRKIYASAGGRITVDDVERETRRWEREEPSEATYTTRLAAELEVDPDQVAGSGPGGKITARDIVAASRLNASLANLATTSRPQFPEGDAFRPNPLVDDLRRSNPALHRLASAEGPAPTLFPGGDLPMTTAAGIDPAVLARVPWMARHGVASAVSSAQGLFDHPGLKRRGRRCRRAPVRRSRGRPGVHRAGAPLGGRHAGTVARRQQAGQPGDQRGAARRAAPGDLPARDSAVTQP
jgi:pyruvate/2-oxoglutarate dehydrogenase complex dihydrolipoamide acyltransferase (E2) component